MFTRTLIMFACILLAAVYDLYMYTSIHDVNHGVTWQLLKLFGIKNLFKVGYRHGDGGCGDGGDDCCEFRL